VAPVCIAQSPQGVGCAAQAGRPAWGWRVWDAAKAIAWHLASQPEMVRDQIVLEMGAGAGLAALVALRLRARAVCATDLGRALPLLIHNAELNGATTAAERSCERCALGVRCPGGHTLHSALAQSEDHLCNVCGLEDPLGGGIELGTPVHTCRACDFDVCGSCYDLAAAGSWESIPGWFRLQTEGEVSGPGIWNMPAADEGGSAGNDAQLLVMPWDLLSPLGSAESGTAGILDASDHWLKAQPSLILIADLSCSAALIQPLVDSIAELKACGRLPAHAKALVCHEAREPEVDAKFEAALCAAGLALQPVSLPAEAKENSRLRMWSIPLA
jgi:hypothetical protein